MKIHFSKYHGTGNDFVLIDDRENKIHLTGNKIEQLCNRRFGIGADGLIMLKSLPDFDFQMIYFNADGKEGSMCGNGGRCITSFAKSLGQITGQAKFSAIDGTHQSIITSETPTVVKLQMRDVHEIENQNDFVYLHTGSPHVVKFVDDVEKADVTGDGRKIRFSSRFNEKGVNVNFVQTSGSEIKVRTYERGVEDETLSCGTGVIASAIASMIRNKLDAGKKEVSIQTRGGKLKVYFEKNGTGFKNIWLEGEATFVYTGQIEI